MRARIKRRQRIRNLTIIATVVVIIVSLIVGFYIALGTGSTGLDKYDGVAVSSADMATLYQVSHAAFGPSGSGLLVSSGSAANLQTASGAPFTDNGKPVVVYIGADFCPYCAAERWALVISLSRFGNFSNLHYMTSANDEGDYATFTFSGSTYSSKYISFQPFEQETRDQSQKDSVPSNYTAEFDNSYPYVNFGNSFILHTLIPDPQILSNKNWTQIFTDISTSDSSGQTIQEGANAITALICKILPTSDASTPAGSVCNDYSITTTNIGLSGPLNASETILATPDSLPAIRASGRAR
jgi:thiol-disulfide isomerase/thioredoxin